MSNVEYRTLGGMEVRIELTVEPTEFPWDGDEPLEQGAEGWDVMAEAILDLGGSKKSPHGTVKAGASLCSTWIMPDRDGIAYLDSVKQDIMDEAVSNLEEELSRLAKGERVSAERRRQAAAKRVMALIPVEEVVES